MSTLKLCIDCAHHGETHDCQCPKGKDIKNLVTGQLIQHLSCNLLRSCFSYNGVQTCGPDCDWFEPKAPDVGEGWRLIDTKTEKYQEGDEWYSHTKEEWFPLKATGSEFLANYFYRRRITPDPGDGYRLLTMEEKTNEPSCLIQEGDALYHKGEWIPFNSMNTGEPFINPKDTIRRLKEPQPCKCRCGKETKIMGCPCNYFVGCTNDPDCWSGPVKHTKQEAIAAWNEVAKKG